MQNRPEFVREYLSAAKALLKAGAVGELLFARGTYQIEVQEKGKKKAFPFLQLKDDGEVIDSFCSCKVSEAGKGCPHLAAAYLYLFGDFEEPLHVRFRKSFWNRLFQMASKRHGYETDCLKKKKGGYGCESQTKKPLFFIEAKTAASKKRLEEILFKREEETEETSIKFSNVAAEEIAKFRAGEASHLLRYELSFWSDLAKWLLLLEDYKISFKGKPLPNEMTIQSPELRVWFYIAEANWPWLIPALTTVKSPLKTFDREEETIEKILYDEENRCLKIIHRKSKELLMSEENGYLVGDWLFVEGKGFYRKRADPLLQKEIVPSEEMAQVLSQSGKELERFLTIHFEPRKVEYSLHFDPHANLHIRAYVFEPGDLSSERAACFVPWAYVPDQGFFLLKDWLFESREKTIPQKEVAEFINRHRLWLQNFPGFHTHVGSLESHLIYRLTPEGLLFEAELNFPQEHEEVLNFDEWIYVKGEGFYMKQESRGRLPLHPGLLVPKEEISSFIASHREDLEQVQGFFNAASPLVKLGLILSLNEEGLITLSPKMEYAPTVDPQHVCLFGDVLYLEGKGFSEIPVGMRLPERYRQQATIAKSQEAAFLTYELESLRPFILELDPRLQKPERLQLKIRRIARDRKRRKSQEWLVDLFYESEIGTVDLFPLWEAFQGKGRYLFSDAGLIALKEPRFHWIRQLPKKRFDQKRGFVRLNTLEWIRLSIFEEIQEPLGADPEAIEARKLFEELQRLDAGRLLDATRLKATLRPYQEQGLQWLWFLYCHGLSGLLCDDMGLGKTHQAMALLAAVSNEDGERQNKYLVVCPTSVIYHWQEQLKRFLPDLRVCTYYGLARSLDDFESHYDLLLTSYGILRTGKENLRSSRFEVAIFDEIQIAKNYASQTHQALRAIRAQMRLGLTGTPIENRLRELKALIDIALPFYLPPDPVFRELFTTPIEKHNDEEKRKLLSRLVKPFLLRRKKSEVLRDLPEKIEEIAYCDLSEEQKEMYRETASQFRSTLYQDLKNSAKPIPYIHVFSALSKLKQICNHPSLIHGDIARYRTHSSGKWDLFTELLQEALSSSQKVVVFSQYLDMLAIIEAYLKRKGIGYASIKGSTRDRSGELRRFREDPACEVFVASLLAAGVGIDLSQASIVIHYDRWWNPAKENQATDRVHRIGQNRGVQVFKLVTKHTIEEHIHEMIERKKGLLEQIIGTEDQISYLSREELLQVFEQMFEGS